MFFVSLMLVHLKEGPKTTYKGNDTAPNTDIEYFDCFIPGPGH